jgi:hypothetical protein
MEKIDGDIRNNAAKQMEADLGRHVREDMFVYQKHLLTKQLAFHLAYNPHPLVTTQKIKKRLVNRASWLINRLEPRQVFFPIISYGRAKM